MITWVKNCVLEPTPAESSKAHWMMRSHVVNAIRAISRDTEFEIFFVGGLPRREILSEQLIRESGMQKLLMDGAPIDEIESKPLPNGAFVPAGTDIDIYVDGVVKEKQDVFLSDFTQRVAKITGYLIKVNNFTDYTATSFLIHTGCHPLARRISIGLDVCMSPSGVPDVDVNQLTLNAKDGTIQLGRVYEKNFPYKWWNCNEYTMQSGTTSFFGGGEDLRRAALTMVLEKIKKKRATILLLPYPLWEQNMMFCGLKVSLDKYVSYVEKVIKYRLRKLIEDEFIVTGLECELDGSFLVCSQCSAKMELEKVHIFCATKESVPCFECEECSISIALI